MHSLAARSELSLFPLSFAAVLLATSSAHAVQGADVRALVREHLGVEEFELVRIALPDGLPDRLTLDFELDGAPVTLDLSAHSVRAPDYRLRVQTGPDGSLATVAPPPPATYRGTLRELPGALAAASLVPDGWKAMILLPDGAAWFIEPLAKAQPTAAPGVHVVYRATDPFAAGRCGVDLLPAPRTVTDPGGVAEGAGCARIARLAIDADFEYFVAGGSDLPTSVAGIDALVNTMNLVYARDVLIEHELGDVIVRAAEPDPYSSNEPGPLLDEFQNEWNTTQAAVDRDLAHLLTGKDPNGNIIGLAYVGVVCAQAWAYGWTQDNSGFGQSIGVVTHELGHNWNAPHCLDPACNAMCGACLVFGPITTGVILAYRNAVGCLDVSNGFAPDVPPHALPDSATVQDPIVIDVLANDFDGNCATVLIEGFDPVSALGGVVELSPGTGPGGRDELRYSPPVGYEGFDSFDYLAGDGSGLQGVGTVTLVVDDGRPDLVLHYTLDELAGIDAHDSSPSALDGRFWGGVLLGQPGAAAGTATSVAFDGVNDRIRFIDGPGLSHLRQDLTVSAWIRPTTTNGTQRILGNVSGWLFGVRDGALIFTTKGIHDYVVPAGIQAGTWTHVAAVFDDDLDVTFYVDGASVGVAPGSNPANPSGTPWFIGTNNHEGEYFVGQIDDVQVYDSALTAPEVRFLFEHPGEEFVACDPPESYCSSSPNSFGMGAIIGSSGQTHIAFDDFTLTAFNAPSFQFGVFFYGPGEGNTVFGDGILCVSGPLWRFPVVSTGPIGYTSWTVDFDDPPGTGARITPGSTWRFQFWFRDPAGPGGSGFNLSDALSATFCP